jgi:chromosome segregation ATPase
MTDQTNIEAATKRLMQALDGLESAIDRRAEIDKSRAILTEQVHALDADRSRLAADLDTQTARARKLEAANRDIARRLDTAMENIRSVLDTQDS